MLLEELINEEFGLVKIPDTEHTVSFEFIKMIYLKIKPLLEKRREAKIKEGASLFK